MTISWGGLGTMWGLPVALVAVRFSRYTFQFMERNDTFTLNTFPEKYREVLNNIGSRSGRVIDKTQIKEITAIASKIVKAPSYLEADLVIECKKIYWNDINPAHFLDDRIIDKYLNRDFHRFYLGEVEGIFGTPNYTS
jgi:flavin reductase (DIM6/NTAB) family NADH-FMN oxidoreductase RutF